MTHKSVAISPNKCFDFIHWNVARWHVFTFHCGSSGLTPVCFYWLIKMSHGCVSVEQIERFADNRTQLLCIDLWERQWAPEYVKQQFFVNLVNTKLIICRKCVLGGACHAQDWLECNPYSYLCSAVENSKNTLIALFFACTKKQQHPTSMLKQIQKNVADTLCYLFFPPSPPVFSENKYRRHSAIKVLITRSLKETQITSIQLPMS